MSTSEIEIPSPCSVAKNLANEILYSDTEWKEYDTIEYTDTYKVNGVEYKTKVKAEIKNIDQEQCDLIINTITYQDDKEVYEVGCTIHILVRRLRQLR